MAGQFQLNKHCQQQWCMAGKREEGLNQWEVQEMGSEEEEDTVDLMPLAGTMARLR